MSYAVKIGTTEASWIDNNPTPPGHVRFDGTITPTLVWGEDIQNLREPTAAEALAIAKTAAIAANRAECSGRIYARYPAGRQLSALAGLYDSANVATMTDWIAANIAAENAAADLIEAAATVAAVEAVTVAWPV